MQCTNTFSTLRAWIILADYRCNIIRNNDANQHFYENKREMRILRYQFLLPLFLTWKTCVLSFVFLFSADSCIYQAHPIILSRTVTSLLFRYNVNVFFFLQKKRNDWSGHEGDWWERRWKDEKERVDKGGHGQRGATEIKEGSYRVEHRDVTELIIGFCCDLAHSAIFFVGDRICISSPSHLPSFAANARIAFNPESLHTKRSARCNSSSVSVAHFSFYPCCFFASIFPAFFSVFTSFESNTAFFYPLLDLSPFIFQSLAVSPWHSIFYIFLVSMFISE